MKKTLLLLSSIGAVSALSSAVNATPRNCNHGSGAASYDRAFDNRIDTLNSAWQNVASDCDKQLEMEGIYGVYRSEFGPTRAACRNAGINAANDQFFYRLSRSCTLEGVRFGASTGFILGREYCDANVAGYSMQQETDFDFAATETCSSVLRRFVDIECPSVATEADFDSRVEKDCKFTR